MRRLPHRSTSRFCRSVFHRGQGRSPCRERGYLAASPHTFSSTGRHSQSSKQARTRRVPFYLVSGDKRTVDVSHDADVGQLRNAIARELGQHVHHTKLLQGARRMRDPKAVAAISEEPITVLRDSRRAVQVALLVGDRAKGSTLYTLPLKVGPCGPDCKSSSRPNTTAQPPGPGFPKHDPSTKTCHRSFGRLRHPSTELAPASAVLLLEYRPPGARLLKRPQLGGTALRSVPQLQEKVRMSGHHVLRG